MTKNRIRLTLLLCLPFVLLYNFYYFGHDSSLIPTGIIQYDNVGYAAYAKQSLEGNEFSFAYSNPFQESAHSPKILFQTQNIFLVLFMKLGLSPAVSVCLFSFICCLLCVYTIVSLYDHLAPNGKRRGLVLTLLVWGGGILALCSGVVIPFRPQPDVSFIDKLVYLDPGNGWWGLSFGRPLYFGVESYYHFLFWLAVLAMFTRKWVLTSILCLILCFSHPFTGIHLLAVLTAFFVIERFLKMDESMPVWFGFTLVALMAIHLYYYLFFLNQFPEHRSVSEQYAANWNYRLYHFGPANILVVVLALVSIFRQGWKPFFASATNRFFILLALISFLLSNHELFMKPMQPIHFARGYEWTAYFFLGLPALRFCLDRLSKKVIALGIFVVLFLFDNIIWFTSYGVGVATTPSVSYITREQNQILELIRKNSTEETLVLGRDRIVPYLSSIYSSAYPWYSHPYTTSFASVKWTAYQDFLQSGIPYSSWKGRDILLLLNKNDSEEFNLTYYHFPKFTQVVSTSNYVLLKGTF